MPGNQPRLVGPAWGQDLGPETWSYDLADPSLHSQESVAVPSVEALAIGSLTAPNSKPCRPSRSAILAARTTWPTAPWTSEPSLFPLLLKRHQSQDSSHAYTSPQDKKPAPLAQLAWAIPVPPRITIFVLLPQLPLKHSPLYLRPALPLSHPLSPSSRTSLTLCSSTTLRQDINVSQSCQPAIEGTD